MSLKRGLPGVERQQVKRDLKTRTFAMRRTLSLLVALACLTTPELARQIASGRGIWTVGEDNALTRAGQTHAGKVLRVFRAPAACLKFARNSTLRALYQWALAEAEADAWALVLDRVSTANSDRPVSAAGPPSFPLFERPPPVTIPVAA
jgi:hypothetical protein